MEEIYNVLTEELGLSTAEARALLRLADYDVRLWVNQGVDARMISYELIETF